MIEVFGKIELPKSLLTNTNNITNVESNPCDSHMGLLSLFVHSRREKEALSVWMMKEYGLVDSWIKLYMIGPRLPDPRLGVFDDATVILCSGVYSDVVLLDALIGAIKRGGFTVTLDFCTYMESLVLLKEIATLPFSFASFSV